MAHDLFYWLATSLECEEGIYIYIFDIYIYIYISVETFQIFYTYLS